MEFEARNVAFFQIPERNLTEKRTAKGAKIEKIRATEGAERSSAVSSAKPKITAKHLILGH